MLNDGFWSWRIKASGNLLHFFGGQRDLRRDGSLGTLVKEMPCFIGEVAKAETSARSMGLPLLTHHAREPALLLESGRPRIGNCQLLLSISPVC